jgi:hypothetical protein
LTGSTNAQGYYTVGNTGVTGVDQTFAGDFLQNGQDAVALYTGAASSFPNGTAITTSNLVDAVVYDTADADDPGLLVLLNAGQPQVDENAGSAGTTNSIQRCPNGSGGARNTLSYGTFVPTPDAVNTCGVVALPLWKNLFAMFGIQVAPAADARVDSARYFLDSPLLLSGEALRDVSAHAPKRLLTRLNRSDARLTSYLTTDYSPG